MKRGGSLHLGDDYVVKEVFYPEISNSFGIENGTIQVHIFILVLNYLDGKPSILHLSKP